MPEDREVRVHLLPRLADPDRLPGSLAVVIDVLRATTTIVQALAAGCLCVRPCREVEEAHALAAQLPAGTAILGGERGGVRIPGFDLGNSPRDFTPAVCRDKTLILTTTNGTRALLAAAPAERILVAGFVNLAAVREQLRFEARPIHIFCAGTDGEPSWEDTLLAGGLVQGLAEMGGVRLNDAARLAWSAFEHYADDLPTALRLGQGGANLLQLGYDEDIDFCAGVDRHAFVPELRREPLRIEIGADGVAGRQRPTGR